MDCLCCNDVSCNEKYDLVSLFDNSIEEDFAIAMDFLLKCSKGVECCFVYFINVIFLLWYYIIKCQKNINIRKVSRETVWLRSTIIAIVHLDKLIIQSLHFLISQYHFCLILVFRIIRVGVYSSCQLKIGFSCSQNRFDLI